MRWSYGQYTALPHRVCVVPCQNRVALICLQLVDCPHLVQRAQSFSEIACADGCYGLLVGLNLLSVDLRNLC